MDGAIMIADCSNHVSVCSGLVAIFNAKLLHASIMHVHQITIFQH